MFHIRERLHALVKSQVPDGKLSDGKVCKATKQLLKSKLEDGDEFEAWYTRFKNQANLGKDIQLIVDLFDQECLTPAVPWREFYKAPKPKRHQNVEYLNTKRTIMRN